jgi:MFS family permease
MALPRDFLFGPWRAVPVLGVTQILCWGALYYPSVLTLPLIAAERGWSISFAMGGFSLGLLVAGLASPRVGAAIDRYGGHKVMPVGSLIGAVGLVALVHAESPAAYLAVWAVLGLSMGASLYDPAFATLGRIFGARARSPITALTLAGGFASTVSWPVTHLLIEAAGWRGTYLVYAALLALIAAPLHAFALPRSRAEQPVQTSGEPGRAPALHPVNGIVFLLVAAAYASYALVPSGLAAHLLAIFQRAGLEPGTVVAIGALFGPSQVFARVMEFIFARKVHPLWVARFALVVLVSAFALMAAAGLSVAVAAAFAILFGAANGLMTITRGAVPLALFGPVGYGRTVGRIAGPALIMQAVAPVVLATIVERASDAAALAFAAGFAAIALVCFLVIRQPRQPEET